MEKFTITSFLVEFHLYQKQRKQPGHFVKWPCFPAVMNLVTFAPCLEVRLDPTLRKKSHGEFAQIGSDCLTRNSPTKKLRTCCSFCTYLEKTPCAIFLNAPSTCQSPKLAKGDSNPTHLIAMIVGTGQRKKKTLQMMNPVAECNKIIKTRERTGLRLI